MLPFYLDINIDCDVSTVAKKNKIEYRVPVASTSYFQYEDSDDLVQINENLIPVFTRIKLEQVNPNLYTSKEFSLIEDYDLISKFNFKNSKKIKARIKTISKYSPKVILD